MVNLSLSLIEKLTEPGARLPWLKEWLLNEIWSPAGYDSTNPTDFLVRGEETVNLFEQLLTSAADRTYGELLSNVEPANPF